MSKLSPETVVTYVAAAFVLGVIFGDMLALYRSHRKEEAEALRRKAPPVRVTPQPSASPPTEFPYGEVRDTFPPFSNAELAALRPGDLKYTSTSSAAWVADPAGTVERDPELWRRDNPMTHVKASV